MGKRIFDVDFEIEGEYVDTATIELDDAVIDAVDDEWRQELYDLNTPEEIAEHIAYNLIVNNSRLSQLDGWADQPDNNARVIEWPDIDQWYLKAKEVTK